MELVSWYDVEDAARCACGDPAGAHEIDCGDGLVACAICNCEAFEAAG